MNRLRLVSLLVLIVLLSLVGGLTWLSTNLNALGVDDTPTTSPSEPNDMPTVSTFGPQRYLAVSREADWPTLHGKIHEANQAVRERLKALGIESAGPRAVHYVFEKDPHTPAGKVTNITVTAEFPFAGELPADADLGEARVVTHEGKTYVASERKGTLSDGMGWAEARDAAEAMGKRRTLEERELYYAFKGMGKDGNHLELQCFVE